MKNYFLLLIICMGFMMPVWGQIPFLELQIDLNNITLSEFTTAKLSQSDEISLIILDREKNKIFKSSISNGSYVLFPLLSYDDPIGLGQVRNDFYFSSTSQAGLRYYQQPSPYYENGYNVTFFEEIGNITTTSFLYHAYSNWEEGAGLCYTPVDATLHYFNTFHSSFYIPVASLEGSIATDIVPVRIKGIQSGVSKEFYFFILNESDGSIHILNEMKIEQVGVKTGFKDIAPFYDEQKQKIYLFSSNETEKSLLLYTFDEMTFTETIIDDNMTDPGKMEISDLNNDSIPELILQDDTGLFLYEFTQFRNGQFTKSLLSDSGEKLDYIVIKDFNNDSKNDILAAKSGSNKISIFQNELILHNATPDYYKASCFPNPANEILTIEESGKISHLRIFDNLGNQYNFNSYNGSIDISEIPNGIYQGTYKCAEKTKWIRFQVIH